MMRLPLRSIGQSGLQWVEGYDPEWTKEPSIEVIRKRTRHPLALEEELDVVFFAEGALNKLHAFDCTKSRFLIRVTLPVAPRAKTDSEVATMATIRQKTIIPVPRIFAFDSYLENELGFEWIIMERIDAQPLDELWHQMWWQQKQLAVYWTEWFNMPFWGFGSLHPGQANPAFLQSGQHQLKVGETVLPEVWARVFGEGLLRGEELDLDISTGRHTDRPNMDIEDSILDALRG